MTRLFAAEVAAEGAHLLDHIAITDRGAVQPKPPPGKAALQSEIGHDRGDQRAARQPLATCQVCRDQRHQLIAIEDRAAFVGDDQPVGIAVERDAEIGAARQHLAAHLLGSHRAAFAVDVEPVRRHADAEHLGAKLPEHGRSHLVGGAVGAIDDDPEAVEPQALREALLDELDIAAAGIFEPLGAAEVARRGAARRPGFDDPLDLASISSDSL